jgi:uncharacterized membrane protein YeaQ/YmgE (transglycosylase-associated protein family)
MIMVFGFITGSLARWAVPGPDPMPIWLTMAIGLAGSAAGGGLAIGIWGKGTQGIGICAFLGSVLLVVAYRHFIQKRPIYGPDAFKFPERGFGIERFQERRQRMEDMVRQAQAEQAQQARAAEESLVQKLNDLHEAGVLTDEELEEKKAQVESR